MTSTNQDVWIQHNIKLSDSMCIFLFCYSRWESGLLLALYNNTVAKFFQIPTGAGTQQYPSISPIPSTLRLVLPPGNQQSIVFMLCITILLLVLLVVMSGTQVGISEPLVTKSTSPV